MLDESFSSIYGDQWMLYEKPPINGQQIGAGVRTHSISRPTLQMKTETKALNRFVQWKTAALAALAVAALASTPALAGDKDDDEFKLVCNTQFDKTNPDFAPNARGRVKIESVGPVEIMDVSGCCVRIPRPIRSSFTTWVCGLTRRRTQCWQAAT
jgi:hypothetical protein